MRSTTFDNSSMFSSLLVTMIVAASIPIGAMTAYAGTAGSQTIATPTTPSVTVMAGTAASVVGNQAAEDIVLKEGQDYESEWSVAAVDIEMDLPDNVVFSLNPTVRLNGTVLTSSFSNGANTLRFRLSGNDDMRDVLQITGIKYNVGPVNGNTIDVSITDPDRDISANLIVRNAKVQGGLLAAVSGSVPDNIKPGGNGQALANVIISETRSVVKSDCNISIVAPDGIVFYEPPVLLNESGFDVDQSSGILSADRKTATFTIRTGSTSPSLGSFTVASKVNVASSVATETDINFQIRLSDAGIPVIPASLTVGRTTAQIPDLNINAKSAPTVGNKCRQAVGNVVIKENKKATLGAGETDGVLTVSIVGGSSVATFADSPMANSSGGIKFLKQKKHGRLSDKKSLGGNLDKGKTTATWTISKQSTDSNGGSIEISGIALNIKQKTGQIKLKISGKATGNIEKEVVVANVKEVTNSSGNCDGHKWNQGDCGGYRDSGNDCSKSDRNRGNQGCGQGCDQKHRQSKKDCR